MFIKTYKTTFKRILRSPLVWVVLLVIVAITVIRVRNGIYIGATSYGYIDTDPRFVLGYHKYHEMIANLLVDVMYYPIPCLCVIAVMTIAKGDYADNFFEIEKSGGVSGSTYFFGRLTAILTFLLISTFLLNYFSVQGYFFTRGGVNNFTAIPSNYIEPWPFTTLGEYLIDSTVVITRLTLLCQFPVVMLYAGVTFAVGACLDSGVLGGIGGSIFVIFTYVLRSRYHFAFLSAVYKYFLPVKHGPYLYISRYDTVFNAEKYESLGGGNPYLSDTLEDFLAWFAVMLGIALLCILIAFIRTLRRKT